MNRFNVLFHKKDKPIVGVVAPPKKWTKIIKTDVSGNSSLKVSHKIILLNKSF